jgi:hypothetical protein
MICLKRKIIFTHPPKCGGTSFEHFLDFKNEPANSFLKKHDSLEFHFKTIKKMGYSPNDFIKISVIRNPWERMVSWYFFLRKRALLELEADGIIKKQIYELAYTVDFNQFVDFINRYKLRTFHTDFSVFMFDESRVFAIDFVIRHENYHTDFIKCIKMLGEEPPKLEDIPHAEQRHVDYGDYKKFYNSRSIQIIENIYKKDINFFNYTFE